MTGFGPPPAGPPQSATGTSGPGLGLPAILGYTAGGLAVLDFIWGFLDWYSQSGGDQGVSGYATGAAAGALAAGIAAGLIAAGEVVERKPISLVTVGLALSGLLVIFGLTVDTQDGADVGVGLILALITSLLQAGVLVYGWLIATGKIAAPQPRPATPPQGFGPPPGGYAGPQGGPGYGPPPGQQGGYPGGPQGGPGYGPPPGQPGAPNYGPPSSQPGGAPSYGPPSSQPGGAPSYGPPSSQPGGAPTHPGGPTPPPTGYGPPQQNPYGPPQQH